jgi:hypothetical protein
VHGRRRDDKGAARGASYAGTSNAGASNGAASYAGSANGSANGSTRFGGFVLQRRLQAQGGQR